MNAGSRMEYLQETQDSLNDAHLVVNCEKSNEKQVNLIAKIAEMTGIGQLGRSII